MSSGGLGEAWQRTLAERVLEDESALVARRAQMIGPIAWAVYQALDEGCSMHQAAQAATQAFDEAADQYVTVMSYMLLCQRATELAREFMGRADPSVST